VNPHPRLTPASPWFSNAEAKKVLFEASWGKGFDTLVFAKSVYRVVNSSVMKIVENHRSRIL
jgi:hypothetical protein